MHFAKLLDPDLRVTGAEQGKSVVQLFPKGVWSQFEGLTKLFDSLLLSRGVLVEGFAEIAIVRKRIRRREKRSRKEQRACKVKERARTRKVSPASTS